MPLDPQAKVLIDLIDGIRRLRARRPTRTRRSSGRCTRRSGGRRRSRSRPGRGPDDPGPGRRDPGAGLPADGDAPKPVIVYFHGGGWVIGSLDTHDGACRALRRRGRRGRRLGRLPARPRSTRSRRRSTTALAALRLGARTTPRELGGDPTRIAVAGDSAGGNLAAVVAQLARDDGGPALVLPAAHLPGDRPRVRQRRR